MQHRVNDGSKYLGTAFDLFASTSAKDSVSTFITSGMSGGSSIAAKGTVRLDSGNNLRQYVEFKDLKVGMSYILVATGKSELGSGYAFCSNYYLTKADTKPPLVNSLSTAHSKTYLDGTGTSQNTWFDTAKEAQNAKYTGTVSISFDKALYYWVDETTRKQIVNRDICTDDNYAAVTAILAGLNQKFTPEYGPKNNTAPCTMLTFKYTSIGTGDTLQLSDTICDKNGNKATVTLNISLQLVKNSEGLYSTEFKIDSGSAVWDGTDGSLTYNPKK